MIDNGLRNAVSFRTPADSGRLFENTVFLELKRRGFEVWYYKSGNNRETDFLINPANPMLIQVCYETQNPKTRKREVDSLLACMKEVNSAEGLILTKNEEEAIETGNGTIRVVPVWKWCL